jgi:serine/threonine protein kinase
MLNGSQMSQTTSGLGTAYYVAPEQLVGSKELDGRADQYSLGIMLYELLAGQVPAGRAQSVRQLRNDVSAVVSDAIDRALSSNPQDRYPNMRTFADVLRGTNQSAGQASPKVIKLLIRH